jgi:predicted AAA+ superfamily ATPase
MIERQLTIFLNKWKKAPSRKPLIMRGGRQVGKTTLVTNFGKSFDQYLYFNLERATDRTLLVLYDFT